MPQKGYPPRIFVIPSEKRFGKNYAWLLVSMEHLAKIYIHQEKYDVAEQMLRAAVNKQVIKTIREKLSRNFDDER